MLCPTCKGQSRVVDSRFVKQGGSIRRRRKCLKCNHRFTTYELGVEDPKDESMGVILTALGLAPCAHD
jgi:transcriptional repressor NrdR